MSNVIDKIKDLFELEELEDIDVSDTNDPDVVVITIRGKLKKDFNSKGRHSDYDRAMRGMSPYAEQVENEG